MIKVTFEFKTTEEAIITLGKLSGIVQVSDRPEPAPAGNPTAKPGRKGRNDAGKLRGAYKKPDSVSSEKFEAQAAQRTPLVNITPAEAQKAVNDAVVNKADDMAREALQVGRQVSPNAPTAADAQKAMEILFNAKGFKVAQEMVLKHGAPRVRDLPVENRLAFIREAAALADAVNSVGSQP